MNDYIFSLSSPAGRKRFGYSGAVPTDPRVYEVRPAQWDELTTIRAS